MQYSGRAANDGKNIKAYTGSWHRQYIYLYVTSMILYVGVNFRCKRTLAQFFWINIEKPRCSSVQLLAIHKNTHAHPHKKKYFNIFRSQHLHQSKSFSSLISDMTIISKSVFYAMRVLCVWVYVFMFVCAWCALYTIIYFRPSESLLIFIFHISAIRSITSRLCRTTFCGASRKENKRRKQKNKNQVQKVSGALVEWWEGYMPHTESMNHKYLVVVW